MTTFVDADSPWTGPLAACHAKTMRCEAQAFKCHP